MIVGSVSSLTVIEKVQSVEFPASSSAVSVTVCVVPSPLRVVPIAGDWVTSMFAAVEQLSATVAPVKSAISYSQFASSEMF